MSGALQAAFQNLRSFGTPAGQQAYTTVGTFSWVCPTGVTSVSVVCVGGGGAKGGGGGALGYKNNYTVVPGNSYTVVVGVGGDPNGPFPGGDSYFVSTAVVKGGGGSGNNSAVRSTYTGDGGGQGGYGSESTGGGGAGGYSGNGGIAGSAGAGGGGGGGSVGSNCCWPTFTGGGGGVGLLGQGASGAAGTGGGGGGGGSGGASGPGGFTDANGALYGGGNTNTPPVGARSGGRGAVRIIWSGSSGITRAFPSTNTGDL